MLDDTESSDETWMNAALAVAESGLAVNELPIGAVIVLDGQKLTSAHTMERAEQRYLVHAELLALGEFDRLRLPYRDRKRAILYSTLEPCLMCLGAAMSAFIGRIVYALPSQSDGAACLQEIGARQGESFAAYQVPVIHGGLGAKASQALFSRYVATQANGPMRTWAESIAAFELADAGDGRDGRP